MTSKKTFLASSFLIILSACTGECSCGTTGNNDDGNGGAGGGSTTGVTAGTGGEGGDGTTGGTGGQGGEGGQGTGGEGGQGTGGEGGQGTGGGGGAGGGEAICDTQNVDDTANCDPDCDATVEGAAGVFMCTVGCDVAEGCGNAAFVCIPDAEGSEVGACLFDCSLEPCPGSSLFVCDQDLLACIPDGLSD